MYKYLLFACFSIIFTSCQIAEHSILQNMENSVKRHIKNNDKEQKLHTNIEVLKAISYAKVEDSEKTDLDEKYIFKVFMKAKWSQLAGSRVYNISDTLTYYMTKDYHVIKRKE